MEKTQILEKFYNRYKNEFSQSFDGYNQSLTLINWHEFNSGKGDMREK